MAMNKLIKPVPRLVMIAGGALLVLLVMASLYLARRAATASDAKAAAEQSAIIESRPFASTLGVAGLIVPGDATPVIASFDAKITQVDFEFGDPVRQGQVLVQLDPTEIRQRLDEARAEYLKATQTASEMSAWENGPEVSQARRAQNSAAFDLSDTRRKVAETKALLDRGLVARDEYDGLVQQQRNQEMAFDAARQELKEALERGRGTNREVAQIELDTSRSRLAEVSSEATGAMIRAPVTGIVIHPQLEKTEAASQIIHTGAGVTRGQVIAAIARPGGLAVSFQLSESDANRVKPGQPVAVTGPGFAGETLTGVVTSVAREATPAANSAGASVTFAASARLANLTPGEAAQIRIGMTANVSVETYRNPSALVAPAAAIQGTAPDTFVTVKDSPTGRRRRVDVRIGQVAPDGVEVLSGLKPGDVVVWAATTSSTDSE